MAHLQICFFYFLGVQTERLKRVIARSVLQGLNVIISPGSVPEYCVVPVRCWNSGDQYVSVLCVVVMFAGINNCDTSFIPCFLCFFSHHFIFHKTFYSPARVSATLLAFILQRDKKMSTRKNSIVWVGLLSFDSPVHLQDVILAQFSIHMYVHRK